MNRATTGIICAILAFLIWGTLPFYWKQLESLSASTVIAHRILWSVIILLPILAARKRFSHFLSQLRKPKYCLGSLLAGALLATNWLIYVWANNNGRIVEIALGYYLLPLIFIALGRLILKEHMSQLQAVAVGLAAVGVGIQAVGLGSLPWAALGVAVSFAFYGLAKKKIQQDGFTALAAETSMLAPFALCFLFIASPSRGPVLGDASSLTLWLIPVTGLATVTPLLLFDAASKRIQLSTIGMLQFIAPTGQFLSGWLYYGEPLNATQTASFVLIWIAVTIYASAAVMKEQRR